MLDCYGVSVIYYIYKDYKEANKHILFNILSSLRGGNPQGALNKSHFLGTPNPPALVKPEGTVPEKIKNFVSANMEWMVNQVLLRWGLQVF